MLCGGLPGGSSTIALGLAAARAPRWPADYGRAACIESGAIMVR
jgi:hypothetical protein